MKHTLITVGALLLGLAGFTATLRAELPEPDNIIYGNVTRGGLPLTAANTDVVVEARRTSDGAVVASYRMGDSPRSGDYYTLRVPLEVFSPILDPLASLTGAPFAIAASDDGGTFAEIPFTMGDRGQFHQLNLVQFLGPDSDGDGLLDAWELAVFGNLDQSATTDKDGDGVRDALEYQAGTNPNDPNDRFRLIIQRVQVGEEVSFVARAANGVGYEGRTRRYTLESSTDLGAANWTPVPGYVNVVGAGQRVGYPVPPPGSPTVFYRAAITLTNP